MKCSLLHAWSSFRVRSLVFSKVGPPVCHWWSWNQLSSLSFQRSEVSKTFLCFKADPQMVTVIALQSKPRPATSLHRPGHPLGRCRRLPLLRVQRKCQFWRWNRCPPIEIISTNPGHLYQLFLSSSTGTLPEWEINSSSHDSKSLSFPLAVDKSQQSLQTLNIHTALEKLAAWHDPVLSSVSNHYHWGHKNKDTSPVL